MAGYRNITNNSIEQMTYTEDRLIEMVKVRMDEIDQNVKTVIDVGVTDNKPVTDIINGLLNECRLDVLKDAKVSQLPKARKTYQYILSNAQSGSQDVDTVLPDGKKVSEYREGLEFSFAHIILPDDALRLCTVECDRWLRIVNTVFSTESKEYRRQFYEFTRSRDKNPVVILIDGTTYGIFPYYKIASGNGNITGDKVVLTYISSLSKYEDLDEQMINALCWDAAAKTFLAMGMPDAASRALAIYVDITGKEVQK